MCVRAAAIGGIELGYKVIMLKDAVCSGADSTHDGRSNHVRAYAEHHKTRRRLVSIVNVMGSRNFSFQSRLGTAFNDFQLRRNKSWRLPKLLMICFLIP